LVIARKELQE